MQRHDYLYKSNELRQLGEALKAVRKTVHQAYCFMNKHPDAKSVVNAIELKHFLGEAVPENLNPEMVNRYPQLKVIAADNAPAGVAEASTLQVKIGRRRIARNVAQATGR